MLQNAGGKIPELLGIHHTNFTVMIIQWQWGSTKWEVEVDTLLSKSGASTCYSYYTHYHRLTCVVHHIPHINDRSDQL